MGERESDFPSGASVWRERGNEMITCYYYFRSLLDPFPTRHMIQVIVLLLPGSPITAPFATTTAAATTSSTTSSTTTASRSSSSPTPASSPTTSPPRSGSGFPLLGLRFRGVIHQQGFQGQGVREDEVADIVTPDGEGVHRDRVPSFRWGHLY